MRAPLEPQVRRRRRSPYWKVQWYCTSVASDAYLSWVDVQKAWDTRGQALTAAQAHRSSTGAEVRLIHVEPANGTRVPEAPLEPGVHVCPDCTAPLEQCTCPAARVRNGGMPGTTLHQYECVPPLDEMPRHTVAAEDRNRARIALGRWLAANHPEWRYNAPNYQIRRVGR